MMEFGDHGTVNVAIIGAGVTSLSLARGILQNPRISVRIYEARPKLGEDGTGVGIACNGQKALSLVDPELRECLDRAGAVKMVPDVRLMLATGPESGTHIRDLKFEPPNLTVVRSRFTTEMLKTIPAEIVQTGKRLNSVEQSEKGDKVHLSFDDGSEVEVDGVIGCDGINSFVRKHVLGAEHPALEAQWTPGFNTRIMIPISEARAVFGDDYCNLQTQTGWIGDGGFCLTDFEDEGETMQVIAGFRSDKPVPEVFGKAFAEVDKEFWLSRLKGWGWIGERISKVVQAQEKVFAVSGRVHLPTPTYINGRICVAGDAARSFAPARGAGAGQGMEDALVLSTVLGSVRDSADIEKAFEVYDRLRRPRREQVAEYSNDAMRILTGSDPKCGTNVDKLRDRVEFWNDLIFDYDLEGLQKTSRELMENET